MLLKIGELARRTGLTVRTLHHYHKIGLLSPSGRNQAGYRLYNRADLTRLHRILTLKRLALSLEEIATLIDRDEASLAQVLQQQMQALDQQIQQAQDLRERLHTLSEMIAHDDAGQFDYWLMTLEKMSVMDKYFGQEELALFKQKSVAEVLQDDALFHDLLSQLKACFQQGLAPENELVKRLVVQWQQSLDQTLPDPGLHSKFIQMHEQEQALHSLAGVDKALEQYMKQASVAYRYDLYRQFFSADELADYKANAMRFDPEWINLFAGLRELMRAGHSPESAEVQDLIRQWQTLSLAMWGQRRDLLNRARQAHLQEPRLNQGGGLTPDLLQFARAAMRWLEQQDKTDNDTQP